MPVVALELPFSGNALVAQAVALQLQQLLCADFVRRDFRERTLRERHFANLMQEPRIHPGKPRHFAHAHAAFKGEANIAEPLRPGRHQHLRQPPRLQYFGAGFLSRLKRAPRLHQRFLEGAAHGHHFADRLHLRSQRIVGAGKLLKLPLGNFHDNVVDGRLETGRRFACDVVRNLVERVANREFCRNFRNRKAGRLRCQRRGTRDARIHLNHRHAPVGRIHRKLHIGAARFHANLAHDGDGRIAHLLILAIGERLRGRHGDGVARMHAHRVEVFNRADDDDVVGEVAHDLELIFLPAEHAFFDQALVHGRKIEPARQNLHQLFAVVADAAA